MSRHSHGRRWIAALAGVAVGTWSVVGYAQGTTDERPATAQVSPDAVAPGSAPPFWVAGVVISPARRSAILVPLDDARRELGAFILQEGESYNGHRLVTVEPGRVLLDRDGTVLSLVVGRPYAGPRGASDDARARTGPIFVPGPDKPQPEVEYTGPQVPRGHGTATPGPITEAQPNPEAVQNFVERLFSHPQIRETIEERRAILRQKTDRARQDGQQPASGAVATPPPGPSR